MAFIVTSKNKARPPVLEGGRSRVYGKSVDKSVAKDPKQVAEHNDWMRKSHDERTRISLDKMKEQAAKSNDENGVPYSHESLTKQFAEVAEHRDKTNK